jgi:hypothetical protein
MHAFSVMRARTNLSKVETARRSLRWISGSFRLLVADPGAVRFPVIVPGIEWDDLTEEKIAAIPLLRALWAGQPGGHYQACDITSGQVDEDAAKPRRI